MSPQREVPSLHTLLLDYTSLFPAAVFPQKRIPDLHTLLLDYISSFSAAAIDHPPKSRLGPGAVARHLEAVYCDELYRCLFTSFGGSFVQREWSGPNSNERIDFRLKVAKDEGWGIECVGDESDWEEHISRALPGGDYALYIEEGHFTQYALVNFRRVQSDDATSKFGSGQCHPTSNRDHANQ